jgi:hypothetical protein
MNTPLPEPMLSKTTYAPCQAPGCVRDDARLYPGGRFCPDHRPTTPEPKR